MIFFLFSYFFFLFLILHETCHHLKQAQIVSQVSTPQQQIYQQPQPQQYPQYYEDTPKQQQQQQQQLPFAGTPLRKEAPITQKPAPVYQSQPVAATFQGKSGFFG